MNTKLEKEKRKGSKRLFKISTPQFCCFTRSKIIYSNHNLKNKRYTVTIVWKICIVGQ